MATASYTDVPDWLSQVGQQAAGVIGGGLTSMQNLPNQWYNKPLVAGMDPLQQKAYTSAETATGAWQPSYQAGLNTLGQAAAQAGQASQWDPNVMQQHLNPYMGGVMDEIARRGNQNLTENILPQVNQTFTGAGSFGGTRNADFTNRAIQNTQREIMGAQGNAMNTAYNQAAQDYYNWGQLGTQGAQAMGGLGAQQIGAGTTGQTNTWQDIQNQMGVGQVGQQNVQAGLTAGYEDWLKQLQTPYTIMGGLGSMLGQVQAPYAKSTSGGGTSNLADILAIIGGTQV